VKADAYMASLGLPQVYAVGGSVRDQLLGRESKDSDYIVREASIAEIRSALAQAGADVAKLKLRDGREVGVRATVKGLGPLEIALPRKEVSTGNGHRDFTIVCDPNLLLAEDAERRDFTINALYRDAHSGEITDPLGGRRDLAFGRICTTHPDSFRDDPLRTLRALRFTSTLGFELGERAYCEMREHARYVTALTLKGVSGTALGELSRLLMGAHPGRALRLARDTGVLAVLLPELASILGFEQKSAYHDKDCDEHTFDAIQAAAGMDASLRVRMALLFHDAGKPWMAWADDDGNRHYYALTVQQIADRKARPTAVHSHEWWGAFLAEQALARLNAPADLRRDVTTLIERHMLPLGRVKRLKVRAWRMELGDPLLADLILHRRCDVVGKGGDTTDALAALDRLADQQAQAIEDRVPRSAKGLAITGSDLVALGLTGPGIGEVQRHLLHEVMADDSLNRRDWLISRATTLGRRAG
jgi:tRNA nucleotidyltransferase (CCA-adding enzyme)